MADIEAATTERRVLLMPGTDDRWQGDESGDMSRLGALVYRSNLLGQDRAVANFGGGNTSSKLRGPDHTGREIETLWVKGSGSDLATITERGFAGLRLAEILPLMERDTMSDEEMVAYLARCQLAPDMPRPSIETLLHAFVPARHVDHTHPDAINAICCAANGEQLARECFGDGAIWIPYQRPGFSLAKRVAQAVREHPSATLVLLAKHGLVTWGDTPDACYRSTIDAINRAAEFVSARAKDAVPFGGPATSGIGEDERCTILAAVLPTLRGAVSQDSPKILVSDTSPAALEFLSSADAANISQVGAACPDHLVHTKMRPLWVAFNPARDGIAALRARMTDGVERYRREYRAYFDANRGDDETMADPNPRVVLIQGVGLVAVGKDHKAATLARDLYHRAIAVMRGAAALDRFVSLTEAESFAIEYWPLELYKLTLAPPPQELAGRVALVTGGAGAIGRATARRLAQSGARVVVADLDAEGAGVVAAELPTTSIAAAMDVTDEDAVSAAFRTAILAFGGVDVVASVAGLASSAPIEETSVAEWQRNHDVLSRGYFLVAREAFRLMKEQGTGGSIIFVASKNALVAGKNAAAYSSAKAAELHLARCLAEEGGAHGIRVNTVNPDAVLQGSKIWSSAWREERARAYGIAPDQLDDFYRRRTTLQVSVYPEDVAEAVLFFASPARSGKSTGNILNVDGGVAAAYPR